MASSQGIVGHVNKSWHQATVPSVWPHGCRVINTSEWMVSQPWCGGASSGPVLLRIAVLPRGCLTTLPMEVPAI